MRLPGLRADAAAAPRDRVAAWSVEASPLVAMALVTGSRPPAPDDPAVDGATLRSARATYGRFPGTFLVADDPFRRTVVAAVRDDAVMARLAGAVLGAGLLAIARGHRREMLGTLPEELQRTARRAFEVERSRDTLSDLGRAAAATAWDVVDRAAGPRAVACGCLARVFGDEWLDELRVLSGGTCSSWRVPAEGATGHDALAAWWMRREW